MIKKTTLLLLLISLILPISGSSFNDTETRGEKIQRVRINFVSPSGNIRPLLLAFTPDDSATDGIDYGYDSRNYDFYPNDLNWIIDDQRFVIQGVGSFNEMRFYELGLYLDEIGETSIHLYGLENFESEIPVFIYDAKLGDYTAINDEPFKREVEPGNHLNRFYIAFSENNTTLSNPESDFENQLSVYHNPSNEFMGVQSDGKNQIKSLAIYSLDGKKVYEINNINSNSINIPTSNLRNIPLIFNVKLGEYQLRKLYIIP